MTLHGTLNHVSITVSNLDEAMTFFRPFLEFFGYTVGTPSPYAGTRLRVNVNEGNGIAINAGSRAHVDAALQIVRNAGLKVLDGPGEFPFAIGGYYAFYFLGPDDLKFEVVYMLVRYATTWLPPSGGFVAV